MGLLPKYSRVVMFVFRGSGVLAAIFLAFRPLNRKFCKNKDIAARTPLPRKTFAYSYNPRPVSGQSKSAISGCVLAFGQQPRVGPPLFLCLLVLDGEGDDRIDGIGAAKEHCEPVYAEGDAGAGGKAVEACEESFRHGAGS